VFESVRRQQPDLLIHGVHLSLCQRLNPRREPVGELAWAAGKRWPVEECFEAAKQEVGLDHYQVRKYDTWYRRITMSMLALCLLAMMRKSVKKGTFCLWTTRRPAGNETAQHG